MKKMFSALFLLFVLYSISYGNQPCHEDCSTITQQEERKAENKIKGYYEKLLNKLGDLEDAYDDYQQAIDDQNELLEQLQALKERNTLLEKEILFFRTTDNQVIGLSIDNTATKKGVR